MENSTTLKLLCLFCNATDFEIPYKDYEPRSGEQILCSNCGRTNDYDSLMRVAKQKAVEWAEEKIQKELDKFKKKLGRLFK